jgi:hypothetical protein
MNDCTLANTSARNVAIRMSCLQSGVLCQANNHLDHATQSRCREGTKKRATGMLETSAGTTDASAHEIATEGAGRTRPLCNERTFASELAHVTSVAAHRGRRLEVLP